jgi:hypothetical protein
MKKLVVGASFWCRFGADWAYTMDSQVGELEYENLMRLEQNYLKVKVCILVMPKEND